MYSLHIPMHTKCSFSDCKIHPTSNVVELPGAARIRANVIGLDELHNTKNTRNSDYANIKICIYLWTIFDPNILFND